MKEDKEDKKEKDQKTQKEELYKQQLQDLEKLFDMDVGSLFVLDKEGSETQRKEAQEKLHSHLRKYGEEMRKIAKELGGDTSELVDEFVKSIESILDQLPNSIDPANMNDYYKLSAFLEDIVKKKLK